MTSYFIHYNEFLNPLENLKKHLLAAQANNKLSNKLYIIRKLIKIF